MLIKVYSSIALTQSQPYDDYILQVNPHEMGSRGGSFAEAVVTKYKGPVPKAPIA